MATGLIPYRPLAPQQKPPRDSRVQAGHPFLRDLQGYWLFNEYGGQRTRNLYGPSGDLVYTGTPEWTRGGAGASGGAYFEAVTPPAVGPLSLLMGLIPRAGGFARYAQWDSIGPVMFNFAGSLAIVFQNSFDFNPGTVPIAVGSPAIIGLTADGSTARLFSFQNGVFTYAEDTGYGRSYTGFLGACRVGAGGLGGAPDAADAVYLWAAIHHRALGLDELRRLCAQAYGPVAPPAPAPGMWYTLVSAATQYAYPSSDVSVGSWTTDTGSTSNLYAAVDESVASDTDYIQSGLGPANFDEVLLRLQSFTLPSDTTGWVLRVRDYKTPGSTSQTLNLRVRLYLADGTTVVHEEVLSALGGTVLQTDISITSLEAATVAGSDTTTGLVVGLLPVAA